MSLDRLEKLLKQAMGLDAASIGASAIERAVQERLSACGLDDADAYWNFVNGSKTELQELIESVVVPETWFFRDREAFSALGRFAFAEWMPAYPDGVLRVLSLPCSTGEEPYSMAMALLDAGFPATRFRIDAVDISARALMHAKSAVYGKNSFRGNELGFRDRYFEATARGYRLYATVCEQVRFQQGNFFDDDFLPGAQLYDVIFCRNVLIYFDRATQDRAVHVLARLLTTKGMLFVGPSETGLLLNYDFVSAKLPLAFAFRKRDTLAPALKREKPSALDSFPLLKTVEKTAKLHPRPQPSPFKTEPRSLPFSEVKIEQAPSYRPLHANSLSLEDAQRLADQGRLVEAAQYCERHLRERGPSAQAFHLLGLVRDASGNDAEAADFYRKALYLDPHHQEALLHLALMLEKQGDKNGAQVLHRRARRLDQKRDK